VGGWIFDPLPETLCDEAQQCIDADAGIENADHLFNSKTSALTGDSQFLYAR